MLTESELSFLFSKLIAIALLSVKENKKHGHKMVAMCHQLQMYGNDHLPPMSTFLRKKKLFYLI